VIKHNLALYRKIGPSGYKILRTFVPTIPSSSSMSSWDIYFNGSTKVTGVCYELINQFAINVIKLQNEMVEACIPRPGVTTPKPPTEEELLFCWLVSVLYDETYIKKTLKMNYQKRNVDGCVDGNSMGTINKNSTALTEKQTVVQHYKYMENSLYYYSINL
jgi:hypothetical protein